MTFSPSFLYLSAVLIWGTTFYAIRFQLGEVPPVVSVMWRFALAAALLFAWIGYRRLPCRFSARQHGWIALQGALLFSVNYVLVYLATVDLTSGLVAVIFAGVVGMNIVNGAVFLGKPVSPAVMLGAALGTAGLALVFWPEVRDAAGDRAIAGAIALALLATYCASLGNILSARNQGERLPVLQTNALGMAYGALTTAVYVGLSGTPMTISLEPAYLLSLLYLSLFGSVLAFGAYLSLVGAVGADRAAYATVMFPLVALGISTAFEGYRWPPEAALGIALAVVGNLLILDKGILHKLKLPRAPRRASTTERP